MKTEAHKERMRKRELRRKVDRLAYLRGEKPVSKPRTSGRWLRIALKRGPRKVDAIIPSPLLVALMVRAGIPYALPDVPGYLKMVEAADRRIAR